MIDTNASATRTLLVGGKPHRKIRRYALTVNSTRHEFDKPTIRVGSRNENDLVLDDTAVSRLHFEIIADDTGFRVRDLGSRNGTRVDSHRIVEIYLQPKSVIVAGGTEIHFELLKNEVDIPATSSDGYGPLVGSSLSMRELYAIVDRAAPQDITILIEGETGTGKELVARAIHERSKRAGGPFVVFDCGAVPANLLESELFGHEKGAFTGATDRRVGLMEQANEGTLFIDELGELPLELQPKLLRALEQRRVRRVGGDKEVPVDIRIVAATNRDLAMQVNQGMFREDLYYRLAVVDVTLPPLRNRRDDVRPLAEHFIRHALKGDPARVASILEGIDEENWSRLRKHPWPGNVRQLRNVIERTLALSDDDDVSLDLPEKAGLAPELGALDFSRPFLEQKADLLARFEESYLKEQLKRHDGNISRAAAAAGIDRMYFKRLLKKYP